jgi:hypothetical protein
LACCNACAVVDARAIDNACVEQDAAAKRHADRRALIDTNTHAAADEYGDENHRVDQHANADRDDHGADANAVVAARGVDDFYRQVSPATHLV